MLRLDNTSVNVETSAVPFEYGGQPGALVFVRDMTDFHKAQLRHQELESQLYQAQKMEAVGRLADGVAHDFNNLLAIVLGHVELMLEDVVMPGMKGPEVYEKIRGSHPEAKMLYMSGYTDEVIVHHGVVMAGIDFIHKPFTTRKLLNKVSNVLHA